MHQPPATSAATWQGPLMQVLQRLPCKPVPNHPIHHSQTLIACFTLAQCPGRTALCAKQHLPALRKGGSGTRWCRSEDLCQHGHVAHCATKAPLNDQAVPPSSHEPHWHEALQ